MNYPNATEAHFYKPNNMFPDCDHHSGDGYYYSDVCACYMDDGSFELCRYMINEDDSSKDKWTCSVPVSVEMWMQL